MFWAVFCLALVGMIGVQAALVDLDAYVTYSIYGPDGTTPLANGSIVYIIGSLNSVVDPPQSYGVTNYIASSVTGDDVILGIVRIGDNVSSNGTFFTTVQYDSDAIDYVYIRFFDSTNNPPAGMVYWGTSSNYFIGPPTLGVSTVDFNPNTANPLIASNYNNFVIVPEPSSANLIVLVAGMAWAMRSSMKRRVKQGGVGVSEGGEK